MIEYFWTCPTCGLETYNDEERQIHIRTSKNDPLHRLGKEEKLRRQYIGHTPQLHPSTLMGSYSCKTKAMIKISN